VLNHGDISTISFHATKLFQTIEGGGVILKDKKLAKELGYLRNFGHSGPEDFYSVGINGKNSEFHAAMGLCNLKYVDTILEKRKRDYLYYMERLKDSPLRSIKITKGCEWNYSYMPIIFESEEVCVHIFEKLKAREIYPRRYFYPTLNFLPYVEKASMPVAEDISKRVLCLPLYYDLSPVEIDMICRFITRLL
jgi:dTDP-4-amino-4,6-dideoxygalactose transaminase